MVDGYDFCGWATKNNIRCSDGRTIRKDAFIDNDGARVPLVWNHQHKEADNVLGHCILENRNEGVYAYGFFNETSQGQNAKSLVLHGDIDAMSIWANGLKQHGGDVLHGDIKEVSLVLAGANKGAKIDTVIQHSENGDEESFEDEGVIYSGETLELSHAESEDAENMDTNKKTVQDIIDSMTDEQKDVLYALVGEAAGEDAGEDADVDDEENNNEEDAEMQHNVFENEMDESKVLSHAETVDILGDMKRYGSLKDSVLAHGIEQIDWLFPEAKRLDSGAPQFIQRDQAWVSKFMNATHKVPFSRIKSMFADIREEDARALGYIKGNYKKEEVFGLLKRTTTPTTIYKKQKFDRDDIIDITEFDSIAWIKAEMRMMLDEEIARACLIGDCRSSASDDKINESNIRPIWTDEDLFTIKKVFTYASSDTDEKKAKTFMKEAVKARKDYKGSGEPTLYTTEELLTNMLLIEDTQGRLIFDSIQKLCSYMRVRDIVTVPVMENKTRTVSGATHNLMGIIVNPTDYAVGADKGGAVNMFDDFDIDYNQQKYLIETRCCGALTKPYSAIVIENKAE